MERAEGEASAATAAATAAARERKEKISTEWTRGTGEAAAATKTTKNEGDMLRSQNNTKDKTAEKNDEIKALIEERRNIKEEDKE